MVDTDSTLCCGLLSLSPLLVSSHSYLLSLFPFAHWSPHRSIPLVSSASLLVFSYFISSPVLCASSPLYFRDHLPTGLLHSLWESSPQKCLILFFALRLSVKLWEPGITQLPLLSVSHTFHQPRVIFIHGDWLFVRR